MRNWILVLAEACVTFLFFPLESASAWPHLTDMSNTHIQSPVRSDFRGLADRNAVTIYVGGHHSQAADDPYQMELYFKKKKALKDAARQPDAGVAAPIKKDEKTDVKVKAKATPGDSKTSKRNNTKSPETRVDPAPSSYEKKSRSKIFAPKTIDEPAWGAE